ncbi:MAG: hypothetical protein ABEJ83_02925 [Candidatus Nanohaloarchaea archaeon]
MKVETHRKSDISQLQIWKWRIEDLAGLYIHKAIAVLSRDPEVKELYQEMREATMNGNQPKALRISEEMKTRVIVNTQEMIG